ncbi:zinc transport system substrate-binding protein [Oceanobacillus limi]|uniref:Zinc transport system substrate-binding protein n=1 Tax=Oceanobacillus limi TaxID=930131 RepID=A0A1I0DRE8_9BACI|nr:zinc ABC transporter substrate-binding protein [Oceanobacillus limi]SET35168.1 zinc transport system substrate-binding protein [Oceanobacillus limi]
MKNLIVSIVILIVGGQLVACTNAEQSTNSDKEQKLTIYTTIYPVQYALERIGGDTVSVETVLPPGVDVHTYEPTTKIMTDVAKSDAFIYLGSGMEGFADSMADALSSHDLTLVELGRHEALFHMENIATNNEDNPSHHHDTDGHNHGEHDPHVWLDPLRMIEISSLLRDTLTELNPSKTNYYTNNFNLVKDDLIDLDESYTEALDNQTNKKILVSHAAYGYWEDRYGLEQLSIHGLSSSNEPSQKELTEIIDQAETYELDYIIFEQNSSNRISEIIQEHLQAKTLIIHNLSVLMEEDIAANEDYLSLMKKNLSVLHQATE